MTDLVNLHYFEPSVQNPGYMLGKAIKEGMWPFTVKQIDLYMDFDIDYNEYRILGGAVLMNGYTLQFTDRVNAWDLADTPEREFLRVANNMRNAFRNREDWPLTSNIKLGEN